MEISTRELLARRLIAQGLAGSAARPRYRGALGVARALLAVQGQTYPAEIRALALRSGRTDEEVLGEVAALGLVRSWPQRGTLHFLPAEDVRWLSRLLYPRVAGSQRGHRPRLGLSEADVEAARRALHGALREGGTRALSRKEAYEVFRRAGVDPEQGRGSHLLRALGGEGEVVQGPRRGAAETFLHVEHLPVAQREVHGAEALTELGARYAAGHGPVSVPDLMAWSKLSKTQAAAALTSAGGLLPVRCGGEDYWMAPWQDGVTPAEIAEALSLRLELPAFDEYLLGYSAKDLVLPAALRGDVLTRNGLSWPRVMEGGVAVASLRAR